MPSPANELSSEPSALYRASANSHSTALTRAEPATRILPSGWIATAVAVETVPAPKSVICLPSPLNDVSSEPSASKRASAKSDW